MLRKSKAFNHIMVYFKSMQESCKEKGSSQIEFSAPCAREPRAARVPDSSSAGALYVHVPFCRAKCRYCDFYSVALDQASADRYIEAVLVELSQIGDVLKQPTRSVFLGGGTPSALPPKLLSRLLEAVSPWVDGETEFSVEVNPGTVDGGTPARLAAGGVNRISLGAQSFDAAQLNQLGRIHQPSQIAESITRFRAAGIGNLSIDLMYALPGQSLDAWFANVEAAMALDIEHVSAYALTVEPDTPLGADLATGRIVEVDEETQRAMYYGGIERFEAAGLMQYETSNFSKPGYACRHNLTYWHNQPYVGVGPGACSYLAGERRTHLPDLVAYCDALARGESIPSECERVAEPLAMAETLFLAWRLVEGVSISAFQRRFGCAPGEAFPRTLGRYRAQGVLRLEGDFLRVTREAMFTANALFADLVAEAEGF